MIRNPSVFVELFQLVVNSFQNFIFKDDSQPKTEAGEYENRCE